MSIKNWIGVLLGVSLLAGEVSYAQSPSIDVGDDSGIPGASVAVPMIWNSDAGGYVGLAFEIDFDLGVLAFSSCVLNEPYASYDLAICRIKPTDPEGDLVEVGLIDDILGPGAIPDGTIGTLNFVIDGGASPGTTDLVLQNPDIGGDVPTLDDGLITILGPTFDSTPGPTSTLALSGQVSTTIETALIVNNDSGADGTTLNYTCAETSDPDNKFSISGDTTNFDVPKGSTGTVVIACDSSQVSVAQHIGELTCTHDGDPQVGDASSPVVYPLSCDVTAGPEPAFSGTPSGLTSMSVPEEGDLPEPAGTLGVQNTGDSTSILTGSCAANGADAAKFTVSNGSFTDLAAQADGGPTHVVNVSCDTTEEGSFTADLECTHNAASSPDSFSLACDVGPPGNAVFGSTIAPASAAEINIDLTPGGPVVENAPVTPIPLNISNNASEANDRDLPFSCSYSGDTEISVGTMSGSPLAPGTSASGVFFSCDTSADGSFGGTYTCDYAEDGGELTQQAHWNVSCEVRNPEAQVEESPPSGTELTITVVLGGSNTTSVTLGETLGEGESGTVEDCSLTDETYFDILSPVSFPVEIVSGGEVTVTIEGFSPPGADVQAETTLVCLYSDSDEQGTQVLWPIRIEIQATSIPTMSAIGQLALILSLLALGGLYTRQRMIR